MAQRSQDRRQQLPGADLVAEGMADLEAGRESEAALAVAAAAPRLRSAGLAVPPGGPEQPSHRLYSLLAKTSGNDAHGRYNAILRRLASYARALEGAGPSPP